MPHRSKAGIYYATFDFRFGSIAAYCIAASQMTALERIADIKARSILTLSGWSDLDYHSYGYLLSNHPERSNFASNQIYSDKLVSALKRPGFAGDLLC